MFALRTAACLFKLGPEWNEVQLLTQTTTVDENEQVEAFCRKRASWSLSCS